MQPLPLSAATTRWVLEVLEPQAQISRVTPLPGATSSSLYRIGVEGSAGTRNVVLRLFTNREWLQSEPDLARHEAQALLKARDVAVPTPGLIAFDEKGEACGVPAVLMTELPGSVDLRQPERGEWLDRLAGSLVPVHQVEAASFAWDYYTYNDLSSLQPPQWSERTGEWAEAIRFAQGHPPEARLSFIHRDYHPVNVLWQNGQVSGIVDWVNACRGPAGIDVGHCRLNLALLAGLGPADRFLARYQEQAGGAFTYHPYWDVVSMLEFLPGPPSVYRGWLDFGLTHLTPELMKERVEAYMLSLVRRLQG